MCTVTQYDECCIIACVHTSLYRLACTDMNVSGLWMVTDNAGIRNWVSGRSSIDESGQPGTPKAGKDEDLPKGESVTLFRTLKDDSRAVDQLLLAPRSACCLNEPRRRCCGASWMPQCWPRAQTHVP